LSAVLEARRQLHERMRVHVHGVTIWKRSRRFRVAGGPSFLAMFVCMFSVCEIMCCLPCRHKPLLHRECAPLGKVSSTITLCSVAGFCVCKHSSLTLRLFVRKFQGTLRARLVKGSATRELHTSSFVVLRLRSSAGDDIWACLADINLNNWDLRLLPMEIQLETDCCLTSDANMCRHVYVNVRV
jgi:hypothetical protein